MSIKGKTPKSSPTEVKVWCSKVYRSRGSRLVQGVLHVEGATRDDARRLLARVAASASGAAREHARQALDGAHKATLVRARPRHAYAAADGMWRGWDDVAWGSSPPAAYARWGELAAESR